MHEAGVTHGGLRLEAVHFDSEGAPVLMGFGTARLIAPRLAPARREEVPGVVDDLSAFARLGGAVLERLTIDARLPEFGPGWLDTVIDWLFRLGTPEPVRLEPDQLTASAPSRTVIGSPVPEERAPGGQSTTPVAALLGLPDDTGPGQLATVAARWTARIRPMLAQVRTRVWVAVGAVAVALVAALTLIPAGRSEVVGEPSVKPAATANASLAAGDPGATAVVGDDPLVALPVLLAAREQCIRDLSVLCLDAVDQAGSGALAYDQALIRGIQDGAELPAAFTVVVRDLRLEERLGDSALVSLGDVPDAQPASVLVMKGDAGWRIRDYLEP
jgi:hypothetical protein